MNEKLDKLNKNLCIECVYKMLELWEFCLVNICIVFFIIYNIEYVCIYDIF